ncbi:MAG: hypothetical protein L3J35_07970 [Bacteroidales bacterium]|nr:hypothetical protein [Bacteroidales bacterium]
MYKIRFLISFLLSFFILEVYAQDFEVGPAIFNFSIDPGESQTKVFTIKNHSNFKTSFTISFADFVLNSDGNKEIMKRNSSKNSCTEWITPEKNFFDVNPNEKIELKITMLAPGDDYSTKWCMMYIQTVNVKTSFDADKSGIGAGVHLSGRIAVQIFRTSVSGAKSDMSIKYLQEKKDSESEERIFSATIENNGTVIEDCKIIFIASDLNSGEEIEFDPINVKSFPGYNREVQFSLPKTLPPGEYSFAVLLDYGINTTLKGTRLKETLIILPQKENSDK